jgi:hypothetical protein
MDIYETVNPSFSDMTLSNKSSRLDGLLLTAPAARAITGS